MYTTLKKKLKTKKRDSKQKLHEADMKLSRLKFTTFICIIHKINVNKENVSEENAL